ncbi:MAG: hypothetical protein IJT51_10445 [Bacteroidales bacterium]|nr:hypothetical protein [Bacteroidales bacterium]
MKKIICLCLSLAFVAAMMISCNKECVCTRSVTTLTPTMDTTYNADSTITVTPSTTATEQDPQYYHGGNIYDKQECEDLNGTDTTSTQITSFTCSWEKKEKKSKK